MGAALAEEWLSTAAAMESRPTRDYAHIAVAVVLFCLAAMAYSLGATYVAALMVLGLIVEVAAWAFLTVRGPRPYSEIEPPQEGGKKRP
jgi:hypothetical protein